MSRSETPTRDNLVVAFSAPPDNPENKAIVEELVGLLELARSGRLDTLAYVALVEDGQKVRYGTHGVRMDLTGQTIGELEMLKIMLADSYVGGIQDQDAAD